MGIVNVDPDSFSGDGLRDAESAIAQGKRFAAEGADIIDVGGESTRPGFQPVSADEELRRVIPVIERLASELPVPVSIDTYKSEVARKAVAAGAKMINDVWELKRDPKLARVAAEAGVPLVISQNQRESRFHDFFPELIASLKKSIQMALDAGVDWNNIIIDPGVGFGKTAGAKCGDCAPTGGVEDAGTSYPLGHLAQVVHRARARSTCGPAPGGDSGYSSHRYCQRS